MKKAVGIFIALFMVVSLQPATANTTNSSIVIIDNAIDSTLPEFSGKLIYEVCTIVSGACPNGAGFQEGLGSATLPKSIIYSGNDSDHGTKMALVALNVNPNAKIIFIRAGRVVGKNVQKDISPAALDSALKWVSDNRSRFNIVSVSSSVANETYKGSCPVTLSTNRGIVTNTISLINSGVAVFYSTGRSRTMKNVGFPACIPQAIAVSAVNRFSQDDGFKVSPLANTGAETDFYALGSFKLSTGDTGAFGQTSPATAALAAYYVKNYKGSYASTYDYLKSIVKPSPTNFVDVLG
jgi:hypothetical protein